MSANFLSLPATEMTGIQGEITPAKSRPGQSRRILLVDDEAAIRQLCSETLTHSGYQVDAAENGETGWEKLSTANFGSASYDLLITDNHMPRLSGFGLIKRVRSAHMALPVIMVSGLAPIAPINAEWLQLSAVLPKPFYPDQLLQVVKSVLREV